MDRFLKFIDWFVCMLQERLHCLTCVFTISATRETQAMRDQYVISKGIVRVSILHMPKVSNRWWNKLMMSEFWSQYRFWRKLLCLS